MEDFFYAEGIEVSLPGFEAEESEVQQFHIQNLRDCDAALVYYGAAGMHWVDFKVRDLQKAAGHRDSIPIPVSAVYLATPLNRRKDRFKSVSTEVVRQTSETFDLGSLADFVFAIRQAKEARTVLGIPIEGPWNAEAAWDSCKARFEQLQLDPSRITNWQTRRFERTARRHSDRGEHEQAKVARNRVRVLHETRLATSPDDADAALALADHLLQLPTDTKTILPTSEWEGVEWLSTTTKPPADWASEDFDDSAWKKGLAAFGGTGSSGVNVRTKWNKKDIWLRRTFEWQPSPTEQSIVLRLVYDDDIEVYVNGQPVVSLQGWKPNYITHLLDASAADALHAGVNTIAVHCHQGVGGQHVDVGVDAMPYEQRLMRRRFSARKITDPWAKLAAAYSVIGDETALQSLLESHPDAVAAVADLHAAEQN